MLTFYPEFEVDNISENEIIFLLDLSNSMKVSLRLVLAHLMPMTFKCTILNTSNYTGRL